MRFGEAVEHMKAGRYVSRNGWRGMVLMFFPALSEVTVPPDHPYHDLIGGDGEEEVTATIGGHFDMLMTVSGHPVISVGWAPGPNDIVATDWMLVDANGQPIDYAGEPIDLSAGPYDEQLDARRQAMAESVPDVE